MKPLTKDVLQNIPIRDLGDILLRPVEYEDYKDMYDYGKDDEVTKMLTWDSYQQIEEAMQSVRLVFLSRPEQGVPAAYAIVDKADQKMIGTCDIFQVDWENESGEIGYVLHRDYWHKGYMTKACKEVIRMGFEYLGLQTITIRHHPDNVGSRRVIEKCGFHYTGDEYFKMYDRDIPSYSLTKEQFQAMQ